MRGGIRHRDADRLKREIEDADIDAVRRQITEEELEAARDRRDNLTEQVEKCRGLLERSRNWVGFEAAPFRQALYLRVGAARCGTAGAKCRLHRRRRGEGDLDLSGSRPANRGRPDLGGDAGHASTAAQERPEAGRLAPGGADPAGGLRGRGRAQRRHRAPAPGAAGGPASPRAVPRPGLCLPRPVPRLPRAGEGLDSSGHPPGATLPLWAPRGAAARGARPAGGPVDRTGPAERSAQGLRARGRDADARPAGAVADRSAGLDAARRHPWPATRCGAARCRGASSAARTTGWGAGRAGGGQVA